MKKALIEGTRIAQVVADGDEFPVASPLSWVDVSDDTTTADTYENGAVVKYSDPAPTVDDVKLEASRRIVAVYPITKQLNMAMRATELQEKRIDGDSLTTSEETEAASLKSAAAWIKSVRNASDTVEAMTPIPADYNADSRWPS